MNDNHPRRTQVERRSQSRQALVAAAANGLATYGYANLVLEQVAREAGYSRGALYHQFANKDELTLAVVQWVRATWEAAVRGPAMRHDDPLESLLTMAIEHTRYCRHHVGARLMMTLRHELRSHDSHPVGRAMDDSYQELLSECASLIKAARRASLITSGPPPELTARAFLAVLESVGIEVAGDDPDDEELVVGAVRGVLGAWPSPSAPGESRTGPGVERAKKLTSNFLPVGTKVVGGVDRDRGHR